MTTAALAAQLSRSVTGGDWPPLRHDDAVTTPSTFDEADGTFMESLVSLMREGSKPNWDGFGARPVTDETVRVGLDFYYSLPGTLPKPDVSAHPDGDLAFEWYFAPRRVLTVTINASGRLNYAWLMGLERQYGTRYLSGKLPEEIPAALRRIRFAGESPVR